MNKLRIGLVVGKSGPKAWHEQVIDLLLGDEAISLVGLYRRDGGKATMSSAPVWPWLNKIETAISAKLFKTPDATRGLSLGSLAEAPPLVDLEALSPKATSTPKTDVTARPDLLIMLDHPGASEDLPQDLAPNIWYLTFDEKDGRADTIGLSSWHRGDHVVEVTLWQAGRGSEPATASAKVIERAYLGVFKQSWSINRSRLLWKAALIIVDNVRRLAKTPDDMESRGIAASLPQPAPVAGDTPGNLSLTTSWIARVGAYIWYKIAYVEQWQILATNQSDNMLAPRTYAKLEPPRDRFWADPFAVQRNGKDYIFVEELRFKSNKGEIAVLEHQDGKLLRTNTIISQPYHMSYPYVFEHEGELYMVPETRKNRTIEIWKNTAFPDGWVKHSDLMTDVSAGDTTLFRFEGRWWMFTNLSRTSKLRSADELHAFHTDHPSPIGASWTAHAQNPLVRDTRCARQGGRVFVDDEGRLIRCAQDTAVRYGYAVLFFHVEELTPTGFSETLLHKVEPDWHDDVVGHHTFERCGDLYVFDACFVRPRLPSPMGSG